MSNLRIKCLFYNEYIFSINIFKSKFWKDIERCAKICHMVTRYPPSNAHWRDSARASKFFIFDAKAAFPMLLFLVHIKLWTFIVAALAMFFFTLLNRYGFSVDVFLRWLRSFLAGPRKTAIPWWMN